MCSLRSTPSGFIPFPKAAADGRAALGRAVRGRAAHGRAAHGRAAFFTADAVAYVSQMIKPFPANSGSDQGSTIDRVADRQASYIARRSPLPAVPHPAVPHAAVPHFYIRGRGLCCFKEDSNHSPATSCSDQGSAIHHEADCQASYLFKRLPLAAVPLFLLQMRRLLWFQR